MPRHFARRVNPLGLLATFLLSMSIVPPMTLAPGDIGAPPFPAAPLSCLTNAECDDGNVCTTDTCNLLTGCVHTNNGNACSDGNACTTGDACAFGTCRPGTATNCNDNNPCTTDSCDPVTGCVHTNNSDTCSDLNACTSGDACVDGACVGTPVSCDDANVCTTDSCNTATGCTHASN